MINLKLIEGYGDYNYKRSNYHVRLSEGPIIAEFFYTAFDQDNSEEVEKIIENLVRDRRDVNSRIRLADIFREKFLLEQSVAEYKEVLDYDPRNTEVLLKLAYTFIMPELNLLSEARSCLTTLMQYDSNNQEALLLLNEINQDQNVSN